MKKYLILIFVALAAVFQSCDNNDDLWDAIDDLKSRVQALETQVDALNGNIEALQKLYGGATISKVETSDGKYVVTLTNGETIELVQGSEAEAVIPIVSINDKGEWQVSTDNGATFTSLGVKAVAEDGTTPRFRIDEATGYWQVSYDGGTSFENVKDTKGQPVKAIGSGTVTDKFFEEVKVDGGDLYIYQAARRRGTAHSDRERFLLPDRHADRGRADVRRRGHQAFRGGDPRGRAGETVGSRGLVGTPDRCRG